MAALKKIPWVVLYAVFVAGWTYWCTRGRDGRLMATFVGFGAFGVVYWLTIYLNRPSEAGAFLLHLVLFEFVVIAALMANPQLDEMAGILNLLIPFIVLAIVLGGLVLTWCLHFLKRG